MTMHAEIAEPSAWIRRFASLAPAGGRVLDVAAGGGRHGRHFFALGHGVTFLDIDVRRLGDLDDVAGAEIVEVDLEGGNSWPFGAARFDVIVVANYLHRPHFERYLESLAPGGLLLHESFALGNAEYGRPRNPDFLLTPGDLARAYGARLHIVAYEHGLDAGPPAAVRQRIACVDRPPPVPIPPPAAG